MNPQIASIAGATFAVLLLAWTSSAEAGIESEDLLDLKARLIADRVYRADESIPFRVTVGNKTDHELLACFGKSDTQQKLLLRVYGENGEEIVSQSSVHVDYGVTVEEDTLLLAPRDERSGTVILDAGFLPAGVGCGIYRVVVVYHCPFEPEETIGGRPIPVARGVMVSEPISVRVDARSWLRRLFGSGRECP